MPKLKFGLFPVIGLVLLGILTTYYLCIRRCGDSVVTAKSDQQSYRLVVLVLSAPENLEQRDTIRKTWLAGRSPDVKAYFAIGLMNLRPEQKLTLESEHKKHGDLLMLPRLYDSYNTITKKVLQSLTYIHQNHEFEFLLKADDDSFALIDQILRELNRWQLKGTKRELYWGYFDGRARVKRSGPWKETDWFLCDLYLPYALGGGYILSYNLVTFIADNADYLKLYNSEDVSMGLWLAPVSNIERRHDTRFDTEYRSRGCSNQYLVTHKQSMDDMRKLHESYTRYGYMCSHEVSNYLGYQYNWTVPPSQCCERRPGIA
ncbi:hypothetical protein TKK_0018382 [Trichogramma kaykai]|uniref:Hexosyltransferase n=1 Tax=Trichogramma kaykai TaxID=54128 RepID=A0ABD2VYA9_9HYME